MEERETVINTKIILFRQEKTQELVEEKRKDFIKQQEKGRREMRGSFPNDFQSFCEY